MKWTKGVLLIVGLAFSFVVLDSGISKINSQTGDSQTLVTGTAGTDFAISSSGNVHTFNMPTASGSNRGLVTTEDVQDFVGAMVDASIGYVDGTPLLQRSALTGAITASAGSNATVLGSFTIADLNTAVSDANVVVKTSKGMTIQNPTASENIGIFYTDHAITITRLSDAVIGSSPSVTYNVRFGATRDEAGTDVLSSNRVANTTDGTTTTSITGDATIPANQWVWVITSATSGTVADFNVTVQYTTD